jgi:hypothetical protein
LGCATGPDSDSIDAGPGADPNLRGCATSTDCPMGTICESHQCVALTCGTTIVPKHYALPNLLVVLDRSCSKLGEIDGQSKWALAVDGVKGITSTFAGRMRFGLTVFPAAGAQTCSAQNALLFPVSASAESNIEPLLTASLNPMDPNHPSEPPCVSSITSGLIAAASDPVLKNAAEKSYMLLVTDGRESGCQPPAFPSTPVASTIKALATNGIRTLVAGFERDVDAAALSSYAVAGGVPNSGPLFYDVSDKRSLLAALGKIAAPATTCTFPLNSVPRDVGQLYVFVDSVFQPNDPTHLSGSDYDAPSNSITLYGQACAQVKAGSVKRIDAVYGCPL